MEAVVTDGILLPDTGFTQPLRLFITTTKENTMKTKPCLCQDDVTKILDAAEKEARAHQWNVTIAVVDDGGHLMGLRRMDGCATISAYIAPEKARTAALDLFRSRVTTRAEVSLRINDPKTDLGQRDLEALCQADVRPDALM